MIRKLMPAALRFVPLLSAVVVLSASAWALAQKTGDKPPVIKDVMKQTHTKDGPLNKVGQAAKGGRWDEATPLAKALVKAGDDLAKAKPPKKGTAASWKKLTKQYQEDTKAVLAAVEKKNAKEVSEAMSTLNASCRDCHSAHK